MASSLYVNIKNKDAPYSTSEMSNGFKNRSGVYFHSLEFIKNGIMTPINKGQFQSNLEIITSYFHISKHI